jgi:hypothetical protein
MASWLKRFVGGGSPTPPFNVEIEAARLLNTLPPCGPLVIIASPRYSGNYRCEVTVSAEVLAPLVNRLAKSTTGGSQESEIARTAFPRWLHLAGRSGTATSYLPPSFAKVISAYVLNFVNDKTATVFCPDCQKSVEHIQQVTRNQQMSGLRSEWTDGWTCPYDHLLYTEDHELRILRRREP